MIDKVSAGEWKQRAGRLGHAEWCEQMSGGEEGSKGLFWAYD